MPHGLAVSRTVTHAHCTECNRATHPSNANRAPEPTGAARSAPVGRSRRSPLRTGSAARGPRYTDTRTSQASLTQAPRAAASQRTPLNMGRRTGAPARRPGTDRVPSCETSPLKGGDDKRHRLGAVRRPPPSRRLATGWRLEALTGGHRFAAYKTASILTMTVPLPSPIPASTASALQSTIEIIMRVSSYMVTTVVAARTVTPLAIPVRIMRHTRVVGFGCSRTSVAPSPRSAPCASSSTLTNLSM